MGGGVIGWAIKRWLPSKHSIYYVLKRLYKMFYITDFTKYNVVFELAKKLSQVGQSVFLPLLPSNLLFSFSLSLSIRIKHRCRDFCPFRQYGHALCGLSPLIIDAHITNTFAVCACHVHVGTCSPTHSCSPHECANA